MNPQVIVNCAIMATFFPAVWLLILLYHSAYARSFSTGWQRSKPAFVSLVGTGMLMFTISVVTFVLLYLGGL